MSEILSFPGLGLELRLNPVILQLTENWAIRWYGVIIAAAFLLAAVYVLRRVKAFGLDADRVIDVLIGSVIIGIIGARLYYVIFSWDTYAANPARIVRIWEGGLAIYGAVIFGIAGAALMCRLRKVKLLPMIDLAMGGLLLGQGIGRWGNFVNMEAFGSNTTLPWGMTSISIQRYLAQNQARLAMIGVEADPSIPVHPTFLYESLWCLIGFVLIALYTKRRRFDGELFLIYTGWYGLGRFMIEGLRTDSLMIGTVRVSQILALLCFVASVVILVVIHSRIRRAGDPDYLPLYVNTPEGQSVLAGTFYPGKKKPDGQSNSERESGATEDAAVEADLQQAQPDDLKRKTEAEFPDSQAADGNPPAGHTDEPKEEQTEAEEQEDGEDH